MADKRPERKGGLGRGIGALIPTGERDAVDVFFGPLSGETPTSVQAGSQAGKSGSAANAGDQAAAGQTAADAGGELLAVPGARFAALDPNLITPNPRQPRSVFEPEAFQELVHSVREFGVLQPIVVRASGDGYELIMGERRLRAAKVAGLELIPAVIRDTTDENLLRDALLENLHRANLNALEEASAYRQLLDDFGITQEQLADRLGRSRPQITNTLRLLKLPVSVQAKVAAGVLSAGHARALLGASDESQIIRLAERVISEGLSVRSLEELVQLAPKAKGKAKIVAGGRTDMLTELAGEISDRLNTPVKIALGRKKGQLTIEFGNYADLKRILAELGLKREQ
jgi:ParB family transcriptional regulator, chromosome partitioning protein